MKRRFGLLVLCALAALPSAVAAERSVTLDPGASHVTFILGTTFHEVHGTMAFSGGAIRFDTETGAASGELSVDARSAATGNDKRDKTMHGDVLESGQYPAIVFRAERVEGAVAEAGHSEVRLVGVMRLHGADHPMTLPATIDSADGRVRAALQFTIPYVEWGLHDPSFLIARAEKTVEVKVEAEGRWDAAGAAPAAR